MSQIEPHFAKRKPRRCPVCRSADVLPIVFGYPTPEDFADAKAGRIALGGCCVSVANPSWLCRACVTAIYPERLRQLYGVVPEAFVPDAF